MVCQGLESVMNVTSAGITDFLQFPLYCDHYFYLKIYFGIYTILAFTIYFEEKRRVGSTDFLSVLGITSVAMLLLEVIGTLTGILQNDTFIYLMITNILFIAIWILKPSR